MPKKSSGSVFWDTVWKHKCALSSAFILLSKNEQNVKLLLDKCMSCSQYDLQEVWKQFTIFHHNNAAADILVSIVYCWSNNLSYVNVKHKTLLTSVCWVVFFFFGAGGLSVSLSWMLLAKFSVFATSVSMDDVGSSHLDSAIPWNEYQMPSVWLVLVNRTPSIYKPHIDRWIQIASHNINNF